MRHLNWVIYVTAASQSSGFGVLCKVLWQAVFTFMSLTPICLYVHVFLIYILFTNCPFDYCTAI